MAQAGLDVAYDVPEDRKFLKKRVVSLLLVVAALVLGGIATALLVFGQPIGEGLKGALPLGEAFLVVWTVVRWALTIMALLTLFALFYYLGPNRPVPRWRWVGQPGRPGRLGDLPGRLGRLLLLRGEVRELR